METNNKWVVVGLFAAICQYYMVYYTRRANVSEKTSHTGGEFLVYRHFSFNAILVQISSHYWLLAIFVLFCYELMGAQTLGVLVLG